jgi:hypothetical protein
VELALEHTHPVPEHHDLDVLVRLGALGRHDEAEDPTQTDVEERESHAGSWPRVDEECQSRGPIGILVPYSSRDANDVLGAHTDAIEGYSG